MWEPLDSLNSPDMAPITTTGKNSESVCLLPVKHFVTKPSGWLYFRLNHLIMQNFWKHEWLVPASVVKQVCECLCLRERGLSAGTRLPQLAEVLRICVLVRGGDDSSRWQREWCQSCRPIHSPSVSSSFCCLYPVDPFKDTAKTNQSQSQIRIRV